MTVEQVRQKKKEHQMASRNLHQQLQTQLLGGTKKHELICRHRLEYGRHPFTCRNCWSYKPVCLCGMVEEAAKKEEKRPPTMDNNNSNIHVVVWMHHREWGLTSNTGCLVPLVVRRNSEVLMKGLPEHDERLNELIREYDNKEHSLVAVLWPKQSSTNTDDSSTTEQYYVSLDEVKSMLNNDDGKLLLIAVDGTWRNARRMVSKLPQHVKRLDLSTDVVFGKRCTDSSSPAQPGEAPKVASSILAPLRYSAGENHVCTAEAVAVALSQLGGISLEEDCRYLLHVAKTKVELIRRYRGKV